MPTSIFFLLLFAKTILGQNYTEDRIISNSVQSYTEDRIISNSGQNDTVNATVFLLPLDDIDSVQSSEIYYAIDPAITCASLIYLGPCNEEGSTAIITENTTTFSPLSTLPTITTTDTKRTTTIGNKTTMGESTVKLSTRELTTTTHTTTNSMKTDKEVSHTESLSTTSSMVDDSTPLDTVSTTSQSIETNTSLSIDPSPSTLSSSFNESFPSTKSSASSTPIIPTQLPNTTLENKSTKMGVSTTTIGRITTTTTQSEGSTDRIPTTTKERTTDRSMTSTGSIRTDFSRTPSTSGTKRTTMTADIEKKTTTTNTMTESTEKEMKESTTIRPTSTEIPSMITTKESTQSTTGYTTTRKSTTTASGYCNEVCPGGFTEGLNYCVRLAIDSSSYSLAIDSCQTEDYGEIVSLDDLTTEYEAIQKILKKNSIPSCHVFVNEFSSSLLRQNRSVRIFFLSSSSSLLTSQANVTKSNAKTEDTLSLCKIPKYCARPNCTTIGMLTDAPSVQFVTQPPSILTYGQSVNLQCTNKTTSSPTSTSTCDDRGNMQPPAVLLQSDCMTVTAPTDNSKDDYEDPFIAMITCDMCLDMGTIDCMKGNTTEDTDKCNCKEGWKGETCYRSPKFCPNMTCDKGAVCMEKIDHAECQCATEECTTLERTKGRDPMAVSLTSTVKGVATVVPLIILVVKVVVKIVSASPVENIQDTVINHRSFMLTINGIIYCLFADPTSLKLDITERRFWSLAFHFTSLAVLSMFYLECRNINDVVHGKSRNQWFTKSSEGRRWDYGISMFFAYVLAAILSITLWFFQWDNQQAPWTSIGSFDNFGMAGWMATVYIILAVGIASQAEIAACYYQQDKTKQLHLDNHYDTTDPCLADEVNMVIRNRNIAPFVVLLQALYFICMVIAIDIPTVIMAKVTFGVSMVNTLASVYQSVYASELLGTVIAVVQMLLPSKAPVYNEYTFRTTRETLACFWKKRFTNFEVEEEQKRKEKEEKEVENAQKIRDTIIQRYPDCPLRLLPSLVIAGPDPMKIYNYDLMDKWYIPARIKEFTMIRWTKLYLSVRIKCCITVDDSIEFVRQYLLDADFLDGAYCTPKEAWTMYEEWQSMMIYQDKLDYEPMKKSEKAKLLALNPASFYDDLSSFCLQNKIRAAPEDPKKKRLLTPVMTLFSRQPDITCPSILGQSMDEFGLITKQLIVRDVPCITRREEKYALFKESMETENEKWDRVYDDDTFVVDQLGGPNETMIRDRFSLNSSHLESQNTKSLNPRKDVNAVNHIWLNVNRPDFIGPRLPRDSLPLGPLYRRYNIFQFYEEVKAIKWKELVDQMARQDWTREERQKKFN